jgi:hypothetical protein
LRRVKAGAYQVDDAGELEIVSDDLREQLRVILGGILARNEICYRQAWLANVAEPCAGLKPGGILGVSRSRQHKKRGESRD